jgi:hypothetical protein
MVMQTWNQEEAHRIREGMPCVPPLVYLWDPGEVDPRQ